MTAPDEHTLNALRKQIGEGIQAVFREHDETLHGLFAGEAEGMSFVCDMLLRATAGTITSTFDRDVDGKAILTLTRYLRSCRQQQAETGMRQ